MSEIPNLEDLLTAIATLTEHNTELLTQREEQYQAMAARDTATAKLVNELTAQLKDYQERENKIKSAYTPLRDIVLYRLEWKNVAILVNNAGLSQGLDPIDKGDTEDWDRMIDTNVKGLLYVTKVVSGWMVERKQGHIINIGSIAGKEVYANGNVYCATKHAVDALNKGMRIDLLPHGIKVSSVNPGMVETEFSIVRFDGDEERAKKVYENIQPLKPEDIAETIYWMASRPAHVNINDLIIMPTIQANATTVLR